MKSGDGGAMLGMIASRLLISGWDKTVFERIIGGANVHKRLGW